MNCGEFKRLFKDKTILAVVAERYTRFYKFESRHIYFFLKKFLEAKYPGWRVVYLYKIEENVGDEDEEVSSMIRDKADFLYLIAKRNEQKPNLCVIKEVLASPDLSHFEGKKTKVISINYDV
ncbi:MAG: hypothetical protein ACOC2K_03335 [Bacteroidota bacterium]